MSRTSDLIDHICKILFAAEWRRIAQAQQKMISRCEEAYQYPLDGFHYLGRFYRKEGLRGKLKQPVLHLDLQPEMDTLIKDAATVAADAQSIRQVLYQLIDRCTLSQDLRDALPECLRDTLPSDVKCLARTREPAFNFADLPRARRAFEKTFPKIQFYATARLLY